MREVATLSYNYIRCPRRISFSAYKSLDWDLDFLQDCFGLLLGKQDHYTKESGQGINYFVIKSFSRLSFMKVRMSMRNRL